LYAFDAEMVMGSVRASAVRWSQQFRRVSPEVRNVLLVFILALVAALLRAPAVAVTATLFGLLLSAWAIRRRGAEAAGPIFFYDLMRLARRGRSTLLRCTYAVLLLGCLYLIYFNRFPIEAEFRNLFRLQPRMRLDELAHFSGTFATGIFALQSAAVLVLTPAYVSGAIAEEKEKRTLELLFTTHLTDREIVLGKLFGRLMHLFGVVLAGLPVLMALQVWGGVEPLLPFAGFFVTLLTLLSVGSICIYCSVVCSSSFSALIVCYLIVVPISVIGVFAPCCFISSPVAFMMSLEMQLGAGQFYQFFWPMAGGGAGPLPMTGALAVIAMTLIYAVPHVAIAIFCGWNAIRSLRSSNATPRFENWVRDWNPDKEEASERRARPVGSVVVGAGWDPVNIEPEEDRVRFVRPLDERVVRIPISDHPLLWKEVYHQAGEWTRMRFWPLYGASVAVTAGVAFLFITVAAGGEWNQDARQSFLKALMSAVNHLLTPTIRVFIILLAGAWCVAAAWRTASSITREREGRTLGALLTLPVERYAVLRVKWWGGILRWRWLGILILALWTVAVLFGAFHPVAALLLAAAVAAHIAFLASIGVNLSLVSRTTMWANFNMSLILLLVFAGSWVGVAYYEVLFGGYASPFGPDWFDDFYQVGLNPIRTWWYLGLNWEEFPLEAWGEDGGLRGTMGATLAGVGVYAASALLLWFTARWEFRKVDAV
jgi:ABC-type transport system involved in multi-copper enzyme maturation permease subunit